LAHAPYLFDQAHLGSIRFPQISGCVFYGSK